MTLVSSGQLPARCFVYFLYFGLGGVFVSVLYVCVVYFNAVCVDVQLCIAVVTVSLSLENELKKKKGQIRGVGLFYHPHTHNLLLKFYLISC